MNIFENRIVRIGILFAVCVALLAIITPNASAYVYDIGQGDTVYQGDTCDLSLVASWPDYQLAWCADDEPGCGSPTIVDLGDENQHAVYIDKELFRVGNYYRWDGAWHRGENSFAMRVLSGPRPANETVLTIGNKTVIESKVTKPAKKLPNSTHIVLARGDNLNYNYAIPNTTEGNNAYMWMFNAEIIGTGKGVLGEPMEYRSNDSVYEWEIDYLTSEDIVEGKYAGYIQYSGDNNRADVFYREHHKIDPVKIEYADILDTLYDDDIIPDVSITGLTPLLVKDRFETLSLNEYSDDTLIPVTMDVESPVIMFTDYSTEGDNITVSGKTPMAAGTIIVFKLDPQQYALDYDIKAHTWSTQAVGDTDQWRTFNITIPINWDEMAIGANHTVVASVDKHRIHTETSKDFKVTDVYVIPTPTPERERVVVEDYGWHRVTPTIEPVITVTEAIETPIVTVSRTTHVPTQTPKPRETNITIPIPVWLGIVALAGAVLLRRSV